MRNKLMVLTIPLFFMYGFSASAQETTTTHEETVVKQEDKQYKTEKVVDELASKVSTATKEAKESVVNSSAVQSTIQTIKDWTAFSREKAQQSYIATARVTGKLMNDIRELSSKTKQKWNNLVTQKEIDEVVKSHTMALKELQEMHKANPNDDHAYYLADKIIIDLKYYLDFASIPFKTEAEKAIDDYNEATSLD